MINIPSKFVIFGAVAAAALVVPGILGPLVFNEAYAEANANNRATANVVNVQAAAAIDRALNNNDVTVCVVANSCR